MRLVRTIDNVVELDYSGKKAGRGAYLCYQPSCWEIGLKKGRLDRVLRTKISLENQAKLEELGKMLSENKRW